MSKTFFLIPTLSLPKFYCLASEFFFPLLNPFYKSAGFSPPFYVLNFVFLMNSPSGDFQSANKGHLLCEDIFYSQIGSNHSMS